MVVVAGRRYARRLLGNAASIFGGLLARLGRGEMAIARVRRMNSCGAAKSRWCSVERVLAVQHNTLVVAGRQKVVVKTEEACGFGRSGVVEDKGVEEKATGRGRLANKRADKQTGGWSRVYRVSRLSSAVPREVVD
jgi:hypothetical protein